LGRGSGRRKCGGGERTALAVSVDWTVEFVADRVSAMVTKPCRWDMPFESWALGVLAGVAEGGVGGWSMVVEVERGVGKDGMLAVSSVGRSVFMVYCIEAATKYCYSISGKYLGVGKCAGYVSIASLGDLLDRRGCPCWPG